MFTTTKKKRHMSPFGSNSQGCIHLLKVIPGITSDCSKPIHIGRTTCFAAFPIYTWKHDQQKCEKGLYGGCHGSKNIFQTLEECQDIAGNICKSRK
ncbi:unnamed protein product [Tenebrio molitor]|nr:unnamed protein product [Tenebrio molitor]